MGKATRRGVIGAAAATVGLAGLGGFGGWRFFRPLYEEAPAYGAGRIDDVSRLNATAIRHWHRFDDIAAASQRASALLAGNAKLAICGIRHSQGGQPFCAGGDVLDISRCRKIVALDPAKRTIRVAAGTRWSDVQAAADPHGLAVAVMQSSNIFTVGGSVSVNVHGRDPRFAPIIDTVRSLTLLTPAGKRLRCGPAENPDLFRHVVGGYGLFGLIEEVELALVPNVLYRPEFLTLPAADYGRYVVGEVDGRDAIGLHYGRLSIHPGGDFLAIADVTNFHTVIAEGRSSHDLIEDENVGLMRALFHLTRRSDVAKRMRLWADRKLLSDEPVRRNNAMRPEVRFLDYFATSDTDILQEYFVPAQSFTGFLGEMRRILLSAEVNLLNVTLRWTKADRTSALPYASEDSIALVLYVNMGRDAAAIARARAWTRKLTASVLAHGGRFYLPYQLWPTKAQFRAAYPGWAAFAAFKRQWDPEERFQNTLYQTYLA